MAAEGPGECYVGLISGTSMDGIDAVVADLSGDRPEVLAATTTDFDDRLREELTAVRLDPDHFPVARLGAIDSLLGDRFAEAALDAISKADLQPDDIAAIGSHGQTIVHHAEADPPFTLQVADPHRIAHRTGITTVADFRRADLAAGGQGAPLAPLLHEALFRHPERASVVVNLGGIANVTLLVPARPVSGFDTGPANCYLDFWYRRHHEDGRYDAGGHWAARGQVDDAWLETLMEDPFFERSPPKSTGIEYFSPAWLLQRLPCWATDRPADVQATLAEWSARSIAEALIPQTDGGLDEVILCGGGAANAHLIERLGRHLEDVPIKLSDAYGLPADHVESTLFAWLARARLNNRQIDSTSVTGARAPVFMGVIYAVQHG